MYLCRCCQRMFYTTMEHYIEGEWYPEPFGRGGSVKVGGDYIADVCPHCQSEDFTEIEFDGYCPHCFADLPDITDKVFKGDLHIQCPDCKAKFIIDKFGDIEEDDD